MTYLEILKAVQQGVLNPLHSVLAVYLPLFFLLPLLIFEKQYRDLGDNEPEKRQEALQVKLKEELWEAFQEELLAKCPKVSFESFRDEILEILGQDPRKSEEARESLLEFARQAKRGGDPRVELMEDFPEGVQRLQERFRERQKELLELQKLQKWNWLLGPLLKHPWGQVWPVLAAILPLGLGFVSVWGVSLPLSSRAVMVSLFLLAIGGVQVYGQCRSYRERAETRIERARAAKKQQMLKEEQAWEELEQKAKSLKSEVNLTLSQMQSETQKEEEELKELEQKEREN